MRKVKNITVCVTPEIYREARHLAADYNSTVSTIVAWLLQRLPAALERSRFPKGGPKPSAQSAAAINALVTPERTGRSLTFQTGHMPDTFSLSGRFLFWSSGPGQACPGPEPRSLSRPCLGSGDSLQVLASNRARGRWAK